MCTLKGSAINYEGKTVSNWKCPKLLNMLQEFILNNKRGMNTIVGNVGGFIEVAT